ncbi:MAG: Molybdopterin molybdenumtransferase, partial [Alphaproteobacteria bacterium MarineAlpha4_Bin2]
MAQLSDDCFAGAERLITTSEALDILAERILPIAGEESVPLRETAGRILAENVKSPVDVPPHDNSAVDGYAVYFGDLKREEQTTLVVGGRAAAGHPLGRPARRGEAIRIFTGAPMPHGPDTVLMQEDCLEADGHVTITPGIKRGANRRAAGEDVTAGQIVLNCGTRLRPQEIGLAAAVGRTELSVFQRVTAAVFSTGDEVAEPGRGLPAGKIYDSNRFMTITALERLGCVVEDLGILPDLPEEIEKSICMAAENHNVLVTSGGMSVGEEDHVGKAVSENGELHFWRLAIKPGRPISLGQVRASNCTAAFVGLPGNPVAAMVTFLLIGRPLILRLGGAVDIEPVAYRVPADFHHKKKKDRREFVRARLELDDDGIRRARKHGASGAG